jgi:integrase
MYISRALEPSTVRSYKSAWNSYLQFCTHSRCSPHAPEDAQLAQYAASLLDRGFQWTTVRAYLTGVQNQWAQLGITHSSIKSMPILQRVLQGGKKTNSREVRTRLPLRQWHLMRMRPHITALTHNGTLLWAALTMGVAGMFRSGELASYKGCTALTMQSLTFTRDSCQLVITLHRDKIHTSPTQIRLMTTSTATCPVTAMKNYLRWRGLTTPSQPLFATRSGHPMTRRWLVMAIQQCLRLAGVPHSTHYTGHSMRRGGATDMAAVAPRHVLQAAGRWSSNAVDRYTSTTQADVATAQMAVGQLVQVRGSTHHTMRR